MDDDLDRQARRFTGGRSTAFDADDLAQEVRVAQLRRPDAPLWPRWVMTSALRDWTNWRAAGNEAHLGVLSLEQPVGRSSASGSLTLGDMVEAPEPVPTAMEHDENTATVLVLLNHLDTRSRAMLRSLYWDGLSLRETGELHGVTESRVCQVRTLALARMRDAADRLAISG